MAKLIVNPTSPSRREVVLSRTLLAIGRDPSNDVVLPDAMVSRRHAVIEYRGSQYFLRDCNSSNGSLINGDRISERGLRDGDLVAIGTARLLFRDDPVIEDAAGKIIHHPSSPRMQCPACHEDYRKSDVFCRYCGATLAPNVPPRTICSACGTAVPLPARFCTACGSRLGAAGSEEAAEEGGEEPPAAGPAEEEPGEAALQEVAQRGSEPVRPLPSERAAAAALLETTTEHPREPAAAPSVRAELQRTIPPSEAFAAGLLLASPARGEAVPARRETGSAAEDSTREARPVREAFAARPAPALARLGAALVDALIVSAGQAVLILPALLFWSDRPPPTLSSEVGFTPILLSVSLATLAVVLGAVYYVFFWGVKAATPGKRLFGLVVEGLDGHQPIGPGRACLRLMGYVVSGLVLGIGFVMIAFGQRGLHDHIAGTRVVRRRGV